MNKVLILDTCILCVWLDIPDMDTCGPKNDKWDRDRVDAKIAEEKNKSTTFVLPLASIIETGNHIAQASRERRDRALILADIIEKSADQTTPWAAFSDQSSLWSPEKLKDLACKWPDLAARGISLGDYTIKDVAEHYAQMGCPVEILTGDQGLKSYEPASPPAIPRRKQRY